MPDPRVPKFRVPAAFVSPAALCLVGGICFYFTLDFTSDEEKNSTVDREFRHAVRTTHEVDARMKEFFKRVNNNDPREEERMRNLMNKGKGNYYSMKRHHATARDIEDFGFVPKSSPADPPPPPPPPTAPTSTPSARGSRHAEAAENSSLVDASAVTDRGLRSGEGGAGEGAGERSSAGEGAGEGKPRKNKFWFW